MDTSQLSQGNGSVIGAMFSFWADLVYPIPSSLIWGRLALGLPFPTFTVMAALQFIDFAKQTHKHDPKTLNQALGVLVEEGHTQLHKQFLHFMECAIAPRQTGLDLPADVAAFDQLGGVTQVIDFQFDEVGQLKLMIGEGFQAIPNWPVPSLLVHS